MATRRRPRLNPVASPTDPFETPGVEQPDAALGGFNFEALRGLSSTLNDYIGAQARLDNQEDRRDRRDAEESAEENQVALAQTPQDRLLGVLNLDFEDSVAVAREFSRSGLKGQDNPYAIARLRKAAALEQVKRIGYDRQLRDPEFFNANASKALLEGNEAADQDVNELRNKIIEGTNITSPQASETVAAYLRIEEEKFVRERDAQKGRIYQQRRERSAAVAVQGLIEAGLEVRLDDRTQEDFGKFAESIKGWLKEEEITTGDRAGAMDMIQRHLEASLLDNVSVEGDGVLHAADKIQEQLGMDELDPWFTQLDAKLQQAVSRQERYDSKDVPEARAAAQSRLDELLAKLSKEGELSSWGSVRDVAFGEQGNEILSAVAAEYGVPVEQLGVVRDPMLSRWTQSEQTKQSDESWMTETLNIIQKGDLGVAEARILAAPGETLRPSDRASLMSRIETAKARAGSDTRSVRNRNQAFDDLWSGQGQLPPEAVGFRPFLQEAFNTAYQEKLDEDPENIVAAIRAGNTAVKQSDEWTQIGEAQRMMGGARLTNDPSFERRVMGQVDRMLSERQSFRQQQTQEVPTPASLERRQNLLMAFRSRMVQMADSLSNDPDVLSKTTQLERNATILGKLESQAMKVLKEVEGFGEVETRTVETAQLNNDTQLQRFEAAVLNENGVKAMTPPPNDQGFVWDGYMASSMSTLDEYLSKMVGPRSKPFQSKGVRTGTFSTPAGLARDNMTRVTPDLVLSMSAKMLGIAPASVEEAGNIRAGDMALDVRTGKDAAKALQAATMAIGITPREVIQGRLRTGVDLQDIWGSANIPWNQKIAAKQVPFYVTTKDVDAAEELASSDPESEPALLMIALGLDPTNSKSVQTFFTWQRDITNKRGLTGESLKNVRAYFKNLPAPKSDDPLWFRNIKKRSRQE